MSNEEKREGSVSDEVSRKAAETAKKAAKKTRKQIKHRQQKKALKKRYARARTADYMGRATADEAGKAIRNQAEKAVQKVKQIVFHGKDGLFILLALMVIYLFYSLTACVPLAETVLQGAVVGTYPVDETVLKDAEKLYCDMEKELQYELDHYCELHPEYNDAVIEQDEIWHDPYVLMSIISAGMGDGWTVQSAYGFIQGVFRTQYEITVEEKSEMADGLAWSTATIHMTNRNLSHIPLWVLTDEQVGMYALYMATHGNCPELFTGPYVSQLKEPMLYDVPEAYSQIDPKFGAMLKEAEKYIGYPYVWGGSSPQTSFDCSGFISWVLNQSGVRNVGRMVVPDLYRICRPVSEGEAKPGDLVFFERTLGEGEDKNEGLTHVGLYVGDGMMIHCGNPISFADLSRTYWQQHVYGYGRAYE